MSLSSCRQSIIWRNLINPVYILQSPITLSLDISIACIETKPPDTDWHWLTVTGVRTPQQHRQPWVFRSPAVRLVCPSPEPSPVQADRKGQAHSWSSVSRHYLPLDSRSTDLTPAPLCSLSPGWAAHFGGCFGSGASDQCENIAWGSLGHCRVLARVLLLPRDGAIFCYLVETSWFGQ